MIYSSNQKEYLWLSLCDEPRPYDIEWLRR